MKVAVLLVSSNQPVHVRSVASYLQRNATLDHDLYVIEDGTLDDQLCEYSTARIPEKDSRGLVLAHNIALEEARKASVNSGESYDYYWILTSDAVFAEGEDAMRILVETMEAQRDLGILSPTSDGGAYPASARRPGGGWRPVTTCEYRGFMIRSEVIESVGFLNPDFRYVWGAIHELSHLLYGQGWTVAYSDDVAFGQLQGPGRTHLAPRYEAQAKRFAYAYFSQIYGPRWNSVFIEAARGSSHGQRIEVDTYQMHKGFWAQAFTPHERADIDRPVQLPQAATPTEPGASQASDTPFKLNVGCGDDRRTGWINVDIDPRFQADLTASAEHLPTLSDGSCAVIEARQLLQHLTYAQAQTALKEWHRLLMAGGELILELPDLARCVELIGRDAEGLDIGLARLFGVPTDVNVNEPSQLHRWAWTPSSLVQELQSSGFAEVEPLPLDAAASRESLAGCSMRFVARTAAVSPMPAPSNAEESQAQEPGDPSEDGFVTKTVLAWPPYSDPVALDAFFDSFGKTLAGRENVGLFLRVDPEMDLSTDLVVTALQDSHQRILGADTLLQIELLSCEMNEQRWRTIGAHFDAVIRLPQEGHRQRELDLMQAPVAGDSETLARHLGLDQVEDGESTVELQACAAPVDDGIVLGEGASMDPALARQMADLRPWLHPVTMKGMTALPGIGGSRVADDLVNDTVRRAGVLVVDLLKNLDMRGKSILDLGSNCGFWSSHYADAGATRVLGIEGQMRYVQQANLFWKVNQFLPEGSYRFAQADLDETSTWELIQAEGPFDVTVCTGILEHVSDYLALMERAAAVTDETLVLDTRVAEGTERVQPIASDEFGALPGKRTRVVPSKELLGNALTTFGFSCSDADVRTYADAEGREHLVVVARKVGAPASHTHLATTTA